MSPRGSGLARKALPLEFLRFDWSLQLSARVLNASPVRGRLSPVQDLAICIWHRAQTRPERFRFSEDLGLQVIRDLTEAHHG